jgi:hypothetical protein
MKTRPTIRNHNQVRYHRAQADSFEPKGVSAADTLAKHGAMHFVVATVQAVELPAEWRDEFVPTYRSA